MEQSPRRSLWAWLAEPVDGAVLAVFRIAFGLTLFVEVCRFFAHGWIARYYVEPRFHFTYYGFGWVHPWPGAGMYVHFIVLGVAALAVAAGVWYRVSAAALWVLFTYVFLLEEARYLNHFYAASLFALLLAVVPAANTISVDGSILRRDDAVFVPRWSVYILRFQTAAIYFFGGLAKLNADWLRGEPMRSWLLEKADNPLVGAIVQNRLELAVFSYGGLLFDLLVVPALLWRRTRPFAFAAAIVFHVINSQLFAIGIFPWMMLAATTLFFEPDWPRRAAAAIGRRLPTALDVTPSIKRPPSRALPYMLRAFLLAYVLVQVFVPLRHFVYPGNVSWTEEGHLFAWHMKLRDKDGRIRFIATDKRTGAFQYVEPESTLASWQIAKMSTRPDMILQFAHHVADERGGPDAVEVRAQSLVSLNGGGVRAMIDPRANLAAEPRSLWPAWWITRGDEDPDVFAPRVTAAPALDAARAPNDGNMSVRNR